MNRALMLLAIALFATGCRKPLPSPDFIEASGRYTNLLAVNGDDAYAMPEMDAVVAQLGKVKEKSSDFAGEQAMAAAIARERARVAADQAAKAKLAAAPVAAPTFPELRMPPPVEPPAGPAEPKPGEEPVGLAPGTAWATVEKKFAGCTSSNGPINLVAADGGNPRQTEGYGLVETPDCKTKLPALSQNLAVVFEGKILFVTPRSTVVTLPLPPGPAPVVPPAPAPAAAAPAAPAPAAAAPTQNPVLAPIKY